MVAKNTEKIIGQKLGRLKTPTYLAPVFKAPRKGGRYGTKKLEKNAEKLGRLNNTTYLAPALSPSAKAGAGAKKS